MRRACHTAQHLYRPINKLTTPHSTFFTTRLCYPVEPFSAAVVRGTHELLLANSRNAHSCVGAYHETAKIPGISGQFATSIRPLVRSLLHEAREHMDVTREASDPGGGVIVALHGGSRESGIHRKFLFISFFDAVSD
jgi:hypothetical protein